IVSVSRCTSSFFLLHGYVDPRDLHSFPTRRSSDLVAGVVACALVGAFNGLVITKFNIVPFIVTLGTMQIVRGVAKWIGKEQTVRSEEHTSELQSRENLVCRLMLEKKK